MKIQQALILVREKYLEEQKGVSTGPKTEEYKRACEVYLATMTTAHYLWAMELAKGMSSV